MNLKTHIKSKLWLAISSTYKAENYNNAILDAIQYLTKVLREKANIDMDGLKLFANALGGKTPKLKINKFQTQSERNAQKGFQQTLMGIYQGIRNPRSHEPIKDTKDTADAIIYFINYLLGLIEQSKEPFTTQEFLLRVFDSDFVESERYAELLTSEIPENKLTDTLIEIYREKEQGDGEKLRYIVRAILNHLSDDQIADFLVVVSDELKITSDENIIMLTLQILPSQLWAKVNETAKLRIENKLIQSITKGKINNNNYLLEGHLGTYAIGFVQYFELKDQLGEVLLKKLEEDTDSEICYVADYLITSLPYVIKNKSDIEKCVNAIYRAMRFHRLNARIRIKVITFLRLAPDEWKNGFVKNIEDLTASDICLLDDTTLLNKLKEYNIEDDLPF